MHVDWLVKVGGSCLNSPDAGTVQGFRDWLAGEIDRIVWPIWAAWVVRRLVQPNSALDDGTMTIRECPARIQLNGSCLGGEDAVST